MAETTIDRAIPFSGLMDSIFGIIILALILFNAKDVGVLVTGFSTALTSGIKAVKP